MAKRLSRSKRAPQIRAVEADGQDTGKPGRTRFLVVVVLAALAAVTLAVYAQVYSFEFTNYDDQGYVCRNEFVKAGLTSPGIRWSFRFEPLTANWHPLTWMSLMLDSQIAGWISGNLDVGLGPDNAAVYHLGSVVLHIANSCLLLFALAMLTGSVWRSAFVAALFALHPMHVESVAWVSERKDVLSTFFWVLTLIFYARWVRSPSARYYVLVVLVFVLGLMAKPMLVSLPLVLMMLDVWPLGRTGTPKGKAGPAVGWARLIREKSPLFAAAAASCVMTVLAQKAGGAMATVGDYPLGVRAANALVSYVGYIGKVFWPTDMAVLYPHPGSDLLAWQVAGSAALLVGVTAAALLVGRRKPYVAVGWLWYVVTLVPVIGLVQVGQQAMADRYTYVPYIGLFIIVAWGVPDLLRVDQTAGPRERQVRVGVLSLLAALALTPLAWATYRQIGVWRNNHTLFTHALRVTSRNSVAHNNLGNVLVESGVAAEGSGDTQTAIRYYRSAAEHLKKAVLYAPRDAQATFNLGHAYRKLKEPEKAVRAYKQAVSLCPTHVAAWNAIGAVFAGQRKFAEAIPCFRKAVQLEPDNLNYRENLQKAEELLRRSCQPRGPRGEADRGPSSAALER